MITIVSVNFVPFFPVMALESCFTELRSLTESISKIQSSLETGFTGLQSMKSPDYDQLMRIESRLVTLARTTQNSSMTLNSRLGSLEAFLMEAPPRSTTSSLPDGPMGWSAFGALWLTLWLVMVLVGMMCLHFANFRYHHFTVSSFYSYFDVHLIMSISLWVLPVNSI